MEKESLYIDTNGLNFENLDKEESIKLFESFVKSKKNIILYDLDLQAYGGNDGETMYIWHPCIAMEFILTKEEVSRLYPCD